MAIVNSTTSYYWTPGSGSIQGSANQITALLTAGGWINTSDSGQTYTFGTTSTINVSNGYQIWRMSDALQATYPVFVKFEFGVGPVSNTPAIWITVGKGSDGSGGITGIIVARFQIVAATLLFSVVPIYIYGSASTSRICFYIGPITGAYGFILGIERSKDTSNANTTDGVIVFGNSNNTPFSAYGSLSGLSRSAPQTTANVIMTGSTTDQSDGFGNITVYPIFPLAQYGSKNPGLNFRFYATLNLPFMNALPISIRGSNHTYLALGTQSLGMLSNWGGAGMLLLYE